MPGIFGKMLGGLIARIPGEARPQTRYDFDKHGYIKPSDGRVAGEAEVKEISAYNEKVAREIAEHDKFINDVVKEMTPIHASLENWKRETPEFFSRPQKMSTQALMAEQGNFPSLSNDLRVAESQLDFPDMRGNVAGEGVMHFPKETGSQIPLQTDLVREQALDQVMTAFAAAADQASSSVQEPVDQKVVLVAQG